MQFKDMFNQQNMQNVMETIDKVNPMQDITFKPQGIVISPKKPKRNSVVKVTYSGLLADSGAQDVYLHYGDSIGNNWIHTDEIRMQKQPNGFFEVQVPIQDGTHFHVSFHDTAGNWDNNSGNNYSYPTF